MNVWVGGTMGYVVSSAFLVSPNDKHSYFVYYVPAHRHYSTLAGERINNWVYNNFDRIVALFGSNGGVVIVPPKSVDWWNAYPDPEIGIGYCLFHAQDDKLLHGHMPLLIISRRPLEKGKKTSDAIVINLLGCRDNQALDAAFDVIIDGIRRDDWDSIQDKLPIPESDIPEYKKWEDRLDSIIQIKPSIFGVSLNLNAAIDRAGEALLKPSRRKKASASRIIS